MTRSASPREVELPSCLPSKYIGSCSSLWENKTENMTARWKDVSEQQGLLMSQQKYMPNKPQYPDSPCTLSKLLKASTLDSCNAKVHGLLLLGHYKAFLLVDTCESWFPGTPTHSNDTRSGAFDTHTA